MSLPAVSSWQKSWNETWAGEFGGAEDANAMHILSAKFSVLDFDDAKSALLMIGLRCSTVSKIFALKRSVLSSSLVCKTLLDKDDLPA